MEESAGPVPDDRYALDPHDPVTLQRRLRDATDRLAAAGLATPRLDAEVLFRHILDMDRAQLFVHLPDSMDHGVGKAFDALLDRRLAGLPVAYLTGTREFMGLPFQVSPDVLIPRPETELLVEWALDWLRLRPRATVIDAGTGSGAIAIGLAALAAAECDFTIVATDISGAALATAQRNADLIEPPVRSRLSFVQGSLLESIRHPVDLVLANLPYLTPEQIAQNPDLDAEPEQALDGGVDGLELVRRLIADLPRVLARDGAAGFELDPGQTATVEAMIRSALPGKHVRTIHDLAGLPRHVVAG